MSSDRTELYPIEVFDEIIDYAQTPLLRRRLYSDDDLVKLQEIDDQNIYRGFPVRSPTGCSQ